MSDRAFAVIAGGGTAGHVMPGLAVADALVARGHPLADIRWIGSERGIETSLVPAAGFELAALAGRGIERRVSLSSLRAALGVLVAIGQGIRILRRWRPRVVLVLGGYASVPGIVGALVWRIPIVVTEQNARAGLANRLAGRVARACAVPVAGTDLPRAEVTGNPVRAEVAAIDPDRGRAPARTELGLPADRTVIAVFAGSLGSRRINLATRALAVRWANRDDVAIRHVIGARDWDELGTPPAEVADGSVVYACVRYEEQMDRLLAAADVVVSRAGGTTVAELAVVGVPAVLVPLPVAPRDHQTANAAALVQAGAAVLVPDGELDADRLEAELAPLVTDAARRASMAAAGRRLGRPDAAAAVAALCEREARRA